MKKLSLILVIIFFTSCCFGCNKTSQELNKVGQNLSNYEINIEFDLEEKSAKVNEKVKYKNKSEDILKQIKFHLYPQFFKEGQTSKIVSMNKINNAYPNGMSYAEFEIERVKVSGEDIVPVFEGEADDILVVNLSLSLFPGEMVDIEIDFSFLLPNCYHRFGYGDNTMNLANFYPIACVYQNGEFSCEPYNANGDPFFSDMANYCVTLKTDSLLIVAGTGKLVNEKIENNIKISSFKAQVVRDFALVMSENFNVVNESVDGIEISYYYFKDSNYEKSLKACVDSIKTFSNLFIKYPYKTFSAVETDFIYGGMEYPNLVMISSEIENSDDYLNVIIHETAHQWWYGLVGNDEFNYPFLDESLTEFSTILFYDNCEGYNLNHKIMIEEAKNNYSIFYTVYNDVLGNLDTSFRAVDEYSTEPEYTYVIYVKGVLMYDSLYQLIGSKSFNKSLKIYCEKFKFKNVTTLDLISSFCEGSNKDLSNFFNSWISGKVVVR